MILIISTKENIREIGEYPSFNKLARANILK